MLNLFLTALPLLGNYLFSQKNKKQSQQTIQTNQKRYEQKLSQLDSLFNRNYYSNILDRSDVRGLLGNLREQMSETTRNLKNKATITGATPETVVTVQTKHTAMPSAKWQVKRRHGKKIRFKIICRPVVLWKIFTVR